MRVIACTAAALFVAFAPAPAHAQAPDSLFLAIPTYSTLDTLSGTDYARTLTNKAMSSIMTKAVMPAVTHEAWRYERRGDGGVFSRLAYAASRTVVTRTRSGAPTFNLSEIAGTAASAGLSNIYYPPADRTVGSTVSRWGSQLLWDTVANEFKEFWPEIRARLRR